MNVPKLSDRLVRVLAGLTDETFGYAHWRAAQFSSPWREREAVLVICREGESVDELMERLREATR